MRLSTGTVFAEDDDKALFREVCEAIDGSLHKVGTLAFMQGYDALSFSGRTATPTELW